MKMRKAFIFSLDAAYVLPLFAVAALAVLLFSSSTSLAQAPVERLGIQADDSISLLSYLRVSDVRRESVVDEMFQTGFLGDSSLNQSILQLVADLWASGDEANLTRARNLTDSLLAGFFPLGVNFGLFAADQSISNRSPTDARLAVVAGRALVSGISPTRAFAEGCVARAVVQKIRGRGETALAYFGGFEGQGNITTIVQGVPSGANITEVYVEANTPSAFVLRLNGVLCGTVNASNSTYSVTRASFTSTNASDCTNAALDGGDNVFSLNFTNSSLTSNYFGGGLVRLTYETSQLAAPSVTSYRHYFNGVDGIINQYTSFHVPGNITNMTGRLHLLNNYTTFLIVGNKTIYEDNNGTGFERYINFSQSNFTAFFNLSEVSGQSVPVRLGMRANATGGAGIADVVLITDVSGSMDWQMTNDNDGTVRNNCSDPNLGNANTQRLSVAKCVDKDFIDIILNLAGNRLALVSFSTTVNSANFSTNATALKAVVDSYSANGGTCIACAINEAYNLLNAVSNASRKKYILVMSDGVANYRATGGCSLTGLDLPSGIDFACLDAGGYANRPNATNWTLYYTGTVGANALSAYNSTYAFATGDSGKFFQWNGTAWYEHSDTGSETFYGIDLYNRTFGLAVGTSAKIYQFNGAAWAQLSDLGSQTLYGVDIWNSTRAAAVGTASGDGYLHIWNGAAWSTNTANNIPFYDVKFVNSSFAFAAGASGKIYSWNGAAWSEYQDTGGETWRSLWVVNSSLAFIAGSGGAIRQWNGTTWSAFNSPTAQQINRIAFRNSTSGIVVTNDARAYEYNGAAWTLTLDVRVRGEYTVGVSCSDPDTCATAFTSDFSAQNANYSSCRIFTGLPNSTVYSVGFGPVATCALANTTLQAVAACGNGTYYASANASQLQDFYRNLAASIVQQSNVTQVAQVAGEAHATLFPDSYFDFIYTPSVSQPYGALSLSRSISLASCQGSVSLPPAMRLFQALATSYSADRWTSNVSVYDGAIWRTAFNLSIYNQTSFTTLGDPFLVYLNPTLFAAGRTNTLDVRTGSTPINQSAECSTDNTLYFKGWVNASVGYGESFPVCESRNVSVYYDLNGDNVADGFTYVLVGGNATNPAIPAENLNQNGTNAIEDAFRRLLDQLDLNNVGGAAGSSSNPIDVALAEQLTANFLPTLALPSLNMTQVSVVVWK